MPFRFLKRLIILPALIFINNSVAGEWSTATYIIKTQIIDGNSIVRVNVYAPSTAIPNPANCNTASYVDIELESIPGGSKEILVNSVNFALLNQHHVALEINETSCSSENLRSLEGIRIEKSHHHPDWPVGDWDGVIPAYNNGIR